MTRADAEPAVTGLPAGHSQPFRVPTRTPRLLLHPPGPSSGAVDGAWWPWTANLTAELHDLISALTPRTGAISRIGFDWNTVSLAQRRIDRADGVRLDGPAAGQAPAVMRLIGADGGRLTLLVIPFDTPPRQADELMRPAVPTAD